MMKQRMPEVALHFAVPFALTAPVLGLRRAMVVSSLALIPDLDVFFHVHRSASHSLVLLMAVSLVVVGLVKKLKPKLFGAACVACLALLCHPVMDMFSTYTPVLYPLIAESVHVNVQGKIIFGASIEPSLTAQVNTMPTEFAGFQRLDAPVFTNEGFIVSLLLVVIPLIVVSLRSLQPLSKPRRLNKDQVI